MSPPIQFCAASQSKDTVFTFRPWCRNNQRSQRTHRVSTNQGVQGWKIKVMEMYPSSEENHNVHMEFSAGKPRLKSVRTKRNLCLSLSMCSKENISYGIQAQSTNDPSSIDFIINSSAKVENQHHSVVRKAASCVNHLIKTTFR